MECISELKKMICSQCGIHKPCIQVKDGGVCVGCWPDYFDANKDGRNTTPAAPDAEGGCSICEGIIVAPVNFNFCSMCGRELPHQ